ncbi:hypothetical protein PybrP1_006509 [[Pythium] brassicae (nom. inval.)]|nr:hypothetical protein PybrP1_006509 [[Pythium] brassicae (nom. inval.)]
MSTCSGCEGDSSTVSHTCDRCGRRNHVFCGVPVGERQECPVRCASCLSASPLVSAFARTPALTPTAAQVIDVPDSDFDTAAGRRDDAPSKPRRAVQVVSTRSDRVRIVKWMVHAAEQDDSKINTRAVIAFPSVFR